jgi:hypothetical protein
VYWGFNRNENKRKELEEKRRLFFKKLLIHEATESIELLKNGPVNLIPIDAWKSIVNSGEIALFRDKAIDLSDTYFQIQNYNYEAKRVKDAIEDVRLHPATTDDSHASMLKNGFDNTTKPATLKRLEDLNNWLMVLKPEPITLTAKLAATLSGVKDRNGKEK